MLDLSVIIVSYNTRDLLRDCLRSVYRSLGTAGLAAEVLVVDNASRDGSAEMVRGEFPGAAIISNAENRGFAAANNQALRQAQGRYLLLLNPDTVVQGDALPALARFMDEHTQAGVACGRLLYGDGSFQHSCFRFPTLLMSFLDFFPVNHRITGSRLNGRYPHSWFERPFPIDHPLGACFIVRREAVEQVGLLDEQFFIYCEEIDWCIRIRRAGWEAYYTPTATIVHLEGRSTQQFRGPMLVELHRSRYRLFRKHYGPAFQWANRQIVRLGMARHALRDRLRVRQGKLTRADLQ